MHACIWQIIYMCHNWGATARAHVQGSFPDLENGWTDCVQIWYFDRDRLVRCRASQLEAHPRSSARAGLGLSLASLSPERRLTGYERARSASEFSVVYWKKSEYERPGTARPGPARPDPTMLFTSLYLCNRRPDSRAVFFGG